MRTGRLAWPTATLLIICVTSCENRDPVAPIAAQQTRDPSGAFAKPLNSSSVQVGWTDSAPNEIGFRIERSAMATGPWVLAGTTDRNVTTFADGGRSSEQQVCYRVFAMFRNGLSNPANSNCTIPPAAPTGLTAAIVDHQAIDLSWTDNSAVEQYYEIERATTASGPFTTVALLAANTTTYRQSGLTTNTTYWYRVRPNRDGGYGEYSNVASATPVFMPPAAPSNVAARPAGGNTVFISWVDNATNETGFTVERSLDQGGAWTLVVNYQSPNVSSIYDYNRDLEQLVCYRVSAYNAQGSSAPSSMDCTAPPAEPTNLVASSVAQPPAVDLTWTDNSGVEDGYEVWRYDGVTAYQIVATLPANAASYHDASVQVDQQYSYYAVAAKDGGGSYSSNVVSAVVATTPPNAPTTASASPYWSSTAVVVYWDDNSTNEQAFRIERSTDGGASWQVAGMSDYAYYGFSDGGRTPELEVCYRVIAFNARGDSPPSPVACTAPPLGATNVTAEQTADGVVLHWSDNSAVEDGYDIMLWTVCSEQPDYWIASVEANATSALIGDMSPGWWCGDYPTAYVVVRKDGGYGDFSNGVYTAPGATGASASVDPPPRASLRRARVKP